MEKKILVTGGAGYIGSHVCKALGRYGYKPVVLDNLCRGHRSAVKWGVLETADIADTKKVLAVLDAHRPAAIIHFAGFGYVGESMSEPVLYHDNNVIKGHRFLEAIRSAGHVRRIIFSSSCSVYGVTPPRPIAENAPLAPISTYGWSKLFFERMLADYGRSYGFESTSMRYFNAAGADPDGELGEDHDPEYHVIPAMLRAAAGREPGITINGGDYDTPDGSCIRDFAHVSDIAEAHVLALERMLQGHAVRPAYNLGTGHGLSLKELAEAIRRNTGQQLSIKIGPRRPGDPPYAVADPRLAAQELGWRCRFSDPDCMIETAWKWLLRTRS